MAARAHLFLCIVARARARSAQIGQAHSHSHSHILPCCFCILFAAACFFLSLSLFRFRICSIIAFCLQSFFFVHLSSSFFFRFSLPEHAVSLSICVECVRVLFNILISAKRTPSELQKKERIGNFRLGTRWERRRGGRVGRVERHRFGGIQIDDEISLSWRKYDAT